MKKKHREGKAGPSPKAAAIFLAWSKALPKNSPWIHGFEHFAQQALSQNPWDTGGENMEWLRQKCHSLLSTKDKDDANTVLDWIHGNWIRVCTDVYNRKS